jgi:hypothetical protein
MRHLLTFLSALLLATTLFGQEFRSTLSLNGKTTAVGNLLRAYPQFSGDGGVAIYDQTNGSSYYNSFQIGIQKRFSHGLQFMGNYSHSRIMQRASVLNAADPTLEKKKYRETMFRTISYSALAMIFPLVKAGLCWETSIGGKTCSSVDGT